MAEKLPLRRIKAPLTLPPHCSMAEKLPLRNKALLNVKHYIMLYHSYSIVITYRPYVLDPSTVAHQA